MTGSLTSVLLTDSKVLKLQQRSGGHVVISQLTESHGE